MKNYYKTYYKTLKLKNDIIMVVNRLGYNGQKAGNCYQGDCPTNHGSKSHKCFVIWPRIQGFKCYSCGEKGDVIKLVELLKKCDHKSAVNYLADLVKMPRLNKSKLSPEEIEKQEKEYKEEKLVYDMLTESAEWFYQKLTEYPEILNHLKEHYKFSEEIIKELKIGFAPPIINNDKSNLVEYLESFEEFKGKIALSGLFSFSNPQGPYYDYFKGRIIFPYWKNGRVVNFIARATELTEKNEYEYYKDKDGNLKDYIKYKKMRTHNSEDEKRKYISKFICDESLMGEDTIRGAKDIIITEGAPDVISAIDHGFSAISPVTTNFRENDFKKLKNLIRGAERVYIINDNETNGAGLKGALKTGIYLSKTGKNINIVQLPKPEDKEKIDLNEFFLTHNANDLKELMNQSKSIIELLIDDLPEDFLKALSDIKSNILPIIIESKDKIAQSHYMKLIYKKTKTTKKNIEEMLIEAQNKRKELLKIKFKKNKIDPEIEKEAEIIANDPLLLKKRIDIINDFGVVGERKVIAMYFATLDSRLLPEEKGNPNTLAVKNAGHFGSGKSYSMSMCLLIYPESSYHYITNGSAKSLYYLKGGLKNKCLIIAEAFQFQVNNAVDSEFVYIVRSLLSEGRVNYQVPEKNENGIFETVEKKLDGPTSFITTTIAELLESQFEDRLITIHPDESIEQTKEIIKKMSESNAGISVSLDNNKKIRVWKRYHEMLKPVDVIIPYAPKISDYLIKKFKRIPIAIRRAYKRILILIKTITCSYQYQRGKDNNGKVISEICDYYMSFQIVLESFKEKMGQNSINDEKKLNYIKENGRVQFNSLVKEWSISKAAISAFIKKLVQDNQIIWVDEYGNEFNDDNELKKAKRSSKAYIKVNESYLGNVVIGLPTPFELTNDLDWKEGGKLFREYDLELNSHKKKNILYNSNNTNAF